MQVRERCLGKQYIMSRSHYLTRASHPDSSHYGYFAEGFFRRRHGCRLTTLTDIKDRHAGLEAGGGPHSNSLHFISTCVWGRLEVDSPMTGLLQRHGVTAGACQENFLGPSAFLPWSHFFSCLTRREGRAAW